jgi:hypothetical protein
MSRMDMALALWSSMAEKVPGLEADLNRLNILLDVTAMGPGDSTLNNEALCRLRDVRFGLKSFLAAMRGE